METIWKQQRPKRKHLLHLASDPTHAAFAGALGWRHELLKSTSLDAETAQSLQTYGATILSASPITWDSSDASSRILVFAQQRLQHPRKALEVLEHPVLRLFGQQKRLNGNGGKRRDDPHQLLQATTSSSP
jgi:hypothetical protein